MEFNHQYTNEIVCPYCGHEQSDSFELIDDDGEMNCGSCSGTFSFERHRRITYSTYKDVPNDGT